MNMPSMFDQNVITCKLEILYDRWFKNIRLRSLLLEMLRGFLEVI